MEIRQGYKQTEVGVIPEEWEVKKLGDICKFSKGKGISKSDITEEVCKFLRGLSPEYQCIFQNIPDRGVCLIQCHAIAGGDENTEVC